MYCSNCNTNVADGAKFCPNCGMPVVPTLNYPASDYEVPQTAPVPEAPEPAVSIPDTPQPVVSILDVPQPADPILDMPQPVAPMYTPVPEVAPEVPAVYKDPAYDQSSYSDPSYSTLPVVPEETISSIFTKGLLGTIFASTFFLSFLGIIFGVIARKKSNEMLRLYGYQPGKARAGRILGTVGMGLGIAMTALFLFYVIYFVFIIAVVAGSGSW